MNDSINALIIPIILVVVVIILGVALAPAPVMIDVKIYESGDPPAYIYCATGTLSPPARFVANGSVVSGKESYC